MATGYKVSTHKSNVFIYSSNEHIDTKIRYAIPFTFTSKTNEILRSISARDSKPPSKLLIYLDLSQLKGPFSDLVNSFLSILHWLLSYLEGEL